MLFFDMYTRDENGIIKSKVFVENTL